MWPPSAFKLFDSTAHTSHAKADPSTSMSVHIKHTNAERFPASAANVCAFAEECEQLDDDRIVRFNA